MTGVTLLTRNPAATEAAGARVGALLRTGDVVALEGPLGAGKTVFVRGLARGAGAEPSLVRSPTFVFHHVYGRPVRLHHIDLYRLGPGADTGFLDIDTLTSEAPLAVEWAEYADLAAWSPVRIRIEPGDGDARSLSLEGDARFDGVWADL